MLLSSVKCDRLPDTMSAPLLTLLVVGLLIALAQAASTGVDIINGVIAKKGSFQYMASVQKDGKHKCGGFLISSQFVLTAAHCDKGENMTVILGTHDLKTGNKNVQRFTVKSRIKPKEYKDVGSGSDIMLLKLSKKVKLTKNVQRVKIPLKDEMIRPNTKCTVAGWGSNGTVPSVTDLHVVSVATIDPKLCQKQWNMVKKKLPNNTICAGGYKTKNGACQGDSGGPLVCGSQAVGIVSFNYRNDCNYPNLPNVYTQISKFLPWIKKNMRNIS
ncbi:hypothetical protein GJAV_G00073690 [Gymnothorax javanicus]|nr:hypothetical protein GJAV_G00073690 [Gymnothorax javanicus]